MSAPFIIYSLPRSRTAWLAALLTSGEWKCYHEHAINLRRIEDIGEFFAQPYTGAVETGVTAGYWLIQHYVPNIRQVVIHRDVEESVRAMMAVDVAGVATYDESKMRKVFAYQDRMLDQISNIPGVLSVDFEELATRDGCKKIWEFCRGDEFDEDRWKQMKEINVQVDLKAFLLHYYTIKDQVENFKHLCLAELRRLRRAGVELRGDMNAIN